MMVGADTPRTIAAVPRIGDHWIPSPRNSVSFIERVLPDYVRALEEVGRGFVGIPLLRISHVCDDEAAGREALGVSFRLMAEMQAGWDQPGERSAGSSFEELKRERLCFGTPEQVAAALIELNARVHAEFVFLNVYLPGMAPGHALEMVTRLGEEVLPVVRRELGTGSLFDGDEAAVSR